MIIVVLVVVGLIFGSFVNALVWRLHQQEAKPVKTTKDLSILRGRSMCPHCRHELAVKDLIPVLSWLSLKGKCRYCGKPISVQYPLVEVKVAVLFVISYIWWPVALGGVQTAVFVLWLALLVGLAALLVYDLRWMLLPSRLIYPLTAIALVQAIINISQAARPLTAIGKEILAVLVGGGIFYVLYQVSKGKWIGGGDIRLGALLGLIAATPARSFLLIFAAALLGSVYSLPLLVSNRLKRSSTIPFGPFLIVAIVIVQLFGTNLLDWYRNTFINF